MGGPIYGCLITELYCLILVKITLYPGPVPGVLFLWIDRGQHWYTKQLYQVGQCWEQGKHRCPEDRATNPYPYPYPYPHWQLQLEAMRHTWHGSWPIPYRWSGEFVAWFYEEKRKKQSIIFSILIQFHSAGGIHSKTDKGSVGNHRVSHPLHKVYCTVLYANYIVLVLREDKIRILHGAMDLLVAADMLQFCYSQDLWWRHCQPIKW